MLWTTPQHLRFLIDNEAKSNIIFYMKTTITLAKALKEKNRIAGEINQLNAKIQRENSRLETSKSTVNVSDLITERANLAQTLIGLKTEITTANVGIYNALARMEEAKAEMQLIQLLNTNEMDEQSVQRDHATGQYVNVVVKRTAHINEERKDAILKALRKQIAALQDEVDNYNAITKISVDL